MASSQLAQGVAFYRETASLEAQYAPKVSEMKDFVERELRRPLVLITVEFMYCT